MLIQEAMTPGPVTVTEADTVAEAVAAMRRGRFRHLPVLRDGRLVGIVAHGDVEVPAGTAAGEIEALMARDVGSVMTPDPVTVPGLEPVEVAARLLHDHRIGGLPVVDDGRLVGILTESDVFRVFVQIMGLLEPSSRLSVLLPDSPGALVRAVAAAGQPGVNLISVVTEPGSRPRTRRLVLRAATINPVALVAALEAAGFEVEGPEVATRGMQ
jgi:acetoin utilization protein AcuB